ncbi:DUF2199 domain-containing protein [Bailinhaonella thermotolerans]|uniref:DUF2199 domain-containing protein n=1 Tax=Bailinhaonella thermotolerans TaxID=1070861 RepID=A0A3A4AYX3_9ACTN|nr:DUF2199 domain-containing protein [Bailinhaonella thermotolerans]RJL35567.1 DUF2199 domain-containing protein [Bailinhaonella thermotolerans]
MTFDTAVTCACCGRPLYDTDRIDMRFGLPDIALDLPESAREKVNGGLLRVRGHGCFARCLLPVRLSGGLELVLGTWMEIGEEDLEHARAVWDDDAAYGELVLTGTLANAVKPWGEARGARLTAVVRDPEEIPVRRGQR